MSAGKGGESKRAWITNKLNKGHKEKTYQQIYLYQQS